MTGRQRTLIAVALLTVAAPLFFACGWAADDGSTLFGDLRISAVHASPAGQGGFSRLVLSIENAGVDRVLVEGVELSAAASSRTLGSLGGGRVGALGPLTLPAGETIDFNGEKLWVEVGPLSTELVPGQNLAAKLVVGSLKIPVAIVVSAPTSAGRSDRTLGEAASKGSIARSRLRGCLPV